jgi:CRISPR-associated protein Csb2
MAAYLALTIHLHDGRFHGMDEWPPSPARVFQALVAGCARGATLPQLAARALEQLEQLEAPLIAAPRSQLGQDYGTFVPNNDADALGRDLSRLSEIRTRKRIRPRLLIDDARFLFAWRLHDGISLVDELVNIGDQLYQLGRGVDMAWASGEVLSIEELDARVREYKGTLFRPSSGAGLNALACPTRGTLRSLLARFQATQVRLRPSGTGTLLFSQPPKPHFAHVAYDAGPSRFLYELRTRRADELQPWPLWKASALAERLRDGAVANLKKALPSQVDLVESTLIGGKRGGKDGAPTGLRVRVLPLPSIGHTHADQAIRRVLVEIPREASIAAGDVQWAFSGLEPCDPSTGVVDPFLLIPASDQGMFERYAEASRTWRSITPLALPELAMRRRIEPLRQQAERKGAHERSQEEQRARAAVLNALRHADVREHPIGIEVQREPFDLKGARAERFAAGTRFAKERLWHVRLRFGAAIEGPLVLGDGRFLGLGVMAPVREMPAAYSVWIEDGLEPQASPVEVARALRRAIMARAQSALGRESLPPWFSGHKADGSAAESEDEPHLTYQADLPHRLVVLAPEHLRADHKPSSQRLRALLDAAVTGLVELRAGRAGLLRVRTEPIDAAEDPLFGRSVLWKSVTPYTVNRHRKVGSPSEALTLDVLAESVRFGLPRADVRIESIIAGAGRGLSGRLTLSFPRPVSGPIAMGRTRYLGGGLFRPVVEGAAQSSPARE